MLAGSLDYEETLRGVARGSRCRRSPTGAPSTWSATGARARGGRARRSGARGARGAGCSGVIIDPTAKVGPAAVARTGRAELHPVVDNAHLRSHGAQPGPLRADQRARRALRVQRAADGARPAAGRDDALDHRVGTQARARAARGAGGAGPPRGGRGRQRPAVPAALGHRPHAAGLAAAAGAARDRRDRGRGAVPGRGRGDRRRRGLLRPLHGRRGPVDRSRSATSAARARRRPR